MIKRFCDICGSPAVDGVDIKTSLPLGGEGSGFAVATVRFSANGRQDGYMGPLDPCGVCVLDLVGLLKGAANKAIKVVEKP